MILAIDIGNTNVSLGVVRGRVVLTEVHIDGRLSQIAFKRKLAGVSYSLRKKYPQLEKVVMCSVVPGKTKMIESLIERNLNKKVLKIRREIGVPIKNNYSRPQQVGEDRLVGAYAAKTLYGAPAIVVDFGTAITFDVISTKGEYEGGLIVPGIGMSLESLSSKTALLPEIRKVKIPKNLVGKNTRESILSGIFNGYGALCSGLIEKLSKAMGRRPSIVLTGGYAHLMRKFISHSYPCRVDRHLIFKGLALLVN